MTVVRCASGLAFAIILAGCTAASTSPALVPQPASPSVAAAARSSEASASPSQPSTPLPSTIAAATPTTHPLTVKEAASAFSALQQRYGRRLEELGETYRDKASCAWTVGIPNAVCTQSQLSDGKAYYAALSDALDSYVTGLREIGFPDSVAADAATLLDLLVDEQRAAHAAVDADTLESFNERADTAVGALRATTEPGQALAGALGVQPPDAP